MYWVSAALSSLCHVLHSTIVTSSFEFNVIGMLNVLPGRTKNNTYVVLVMVKNSLFVNYNYSYSYLFPSAVI